MLNFFISKNAVMSLVALSKQNFVSIPFKLKYIMGNNSTGCKPDPNQIVNLTYFKEI